MTRVAGRFVVLAVTGSIAVYKMVELARHLVQSGATVQVVMTKSAAEFVTPLTFQALTYRPVEITLREPRERCRERRHDRAEHQSVNIIEREILATEKRVNHHRELVLSLVMPRRGPPRRDELRSVIHAEDDIRVPDVRGEQGGH